MARRSLLQEDHNFKLCMADLDEERAKNKEK